MLHYPLFLSPLPFTLEELVLDCIPFSDLHSSSKKYEVPKIVRERLRSLCCDEKYSTNHAWITEWKSLLNPGQVSAYISRYCIISRVFAVVIPIPCCHGNSSLHRVHAIFSSANICKEDVVVCLLEVMFGNKSMSVQDQMSMLFEILSPSRQYNFPAVSYH